MANFSDSKPSQTAKAQPRRDAQRVRSGLPRLLEKLRAWAGWPSSATQPARASADGYAALFLHAPSPIFIHDEGLIIHTNAAAAELFGYASADSMAGLQIQALCQDEATRQLFEERVALSRTMVLGDRLPVVRFRLQHRDGHDVHVRAVSSKELWHGRAVIIAHFLDDSATVRAESALRESESLFEGVFNASPFAICVSEPDTGRLNRVNAAFCEMIGRKAEDVLGRSTIEFGLWEGGAEQRNRVLQSLRQSGDRPFFSAELKRGDGELITVHGGTAFVGESGHAQLLFIGSDITDQLRKQAELEAVMANAPVAIMVTEGPIIRSASPRLRDISGVPGLQPEGLHVRHMWRDVGDYEAVWALARQQLSATGRVEMVRAHTRPDGSTIQLRVEGSPLRSARPGDRAMVWILSDVTAEMEAFRAREVAEASSRAKGSFLAVMSHELRTPLNGILGLAELARARDTKAAERKEYLHQLADCAHSLAEILNDILDLSKIEAGRMEINPEAVNLNDFFARLQSAYTSLAEARGLELRFWVDPNLPRAVFLDPVRLRQIIANYLGNALKFTPHGQIELLATTSNARVRIEVRDSGIGIPEELLPRLFSPFEQASNTSRSRAAGTGLGLAICKQLARLMGGEVGAQPNPEGGSVFWVDLPLERPDAHAVARAQEQQQAVDVELNGVRVLLAEDNEINALITMRALASAGATAHRVADGKAAVEAAEEAYATGQPYVVVLMDVQMPVMDGLQATRELRMRACGSGLRIVALTAGALSEQREECRMAGMDAHLTKPLHRERLLAEVLLQSKLSRIGPAASELSF